MHSIVEMAPEISGKWLVASSEVTVASSEGIGKVSIVRREVMRTLSDWRVRNSGSCDFPIVSCQIALLAKVISCQSKESGSLKSHESLRVGLEVASR